MLNINARYVPVSDKDFAKTVVKSLCLLAGRFIQIMKAVYLREKLSDPLSHYFSTTFLDMIVM